MLLRWVKSRAFFLGVFRNSAVYIIGRRNLEKPISLVESGDIKFLRVSPNSAVYLMVDITTRRQYTADSMWVI